MNAPDTQSKTSVNRLAQAQVFALMTLVKNWHDSKTIALTDTYEGLASAASRELGINITAHNVSGAFKALEIKLPEAPRAPEVLVQERLKALETRCGVLEAQLNMLSGIFNASR